MAFSLKRQNIRQASITIAVIALISQGFGLVREMTIANYLGTSAEYDILLVSMAIPSMVGMLLFMAIPAAGIPSIQTHIKHAGSEFRILSSRFFKVNGLLSIILFLVVFFTLPYAGRVLASGMDKPAVEKIILYGRIFSFLIPLRTLEAVFRSYLHVNKSFLFPALSAFGFNAAVILLILLMYRIEGPPVFVIAWIVGAALQTLIVLIPSIALFGRKEFGSEKEYFETSKYLSFLFVIIMVEGFGVVVDPFDRYLAGNMLAGGYVSANSYAVMLSSAMRILVYAIATAVFPSMAEMAAGGENSRLSRLYHKALMISFMLIVPIAYFLFLYARDIVSLVFERGRFGEQSTMMTVEVLKYYLIGIVFTAAFSVQLRLSYALRLWKILIFTRLISFLPKLGLGFLFITDDWALAIGGGTVTMFFVSFVIVEWYLVFKKKLGYTGGDVRSLIKGGVSVAASIGTMAVAAGILQHFMICGSVVRLAVVGIVGLSCLSLMAMGLKVVRLGGGSSGSGFRQKGVE